ncbi:MAG: hypothetical protein ACPGWR_03675 [Ardenticatenaceae bacterium]
MNNINLENTNRTLEKVETPTEKTVVLDILDLEIEELENRLAFDGILGDDEPGDPGGGSNWACCCTCTPTWDDGEWLGV